MMNDYYVNDLSFEGQFTVDTASLFQREIALLSSVFELLQARGLKLHLSRSVLCQPVCISTDGKIINTVNDIVNQLDHGMAAFFWERINAWSFASIEDEFDGVRVFFAGKDISDFGPARAAVCSYLDDSKPMRIFSSATSITYSGNTLNFNIQEKLKTAPTSIRVTNLTNRNNVIIDLGDTLVLPNNWENALNYFVEKYEYICFTDRLRGQMLVDPWHPNLFSQIDGKLLRLNVIVSTVVNLREARNKGDAQKIASLTKQYNEQYHDMFEHKSSSFSDESDSNKNTYRKELTIRITENRTEFCPFHTKFAFKDFRLHFTWPISDTDHSSFIAYLGPKITM
jgi:hypothetical protein